MSTTSTTDVPCADAALPSLDDILVRCAVCGGRVYLVAADRYGERLDVVHASGPGRARHRAVADRTPLPGCGDPGYRRVS